MNALGLAILSVIGFLAIYILIDRICKCFESCAMVKGAAKWMNNKDNVKGNGNDQIKKGE